MSVYEVIKNDINAALPDQKDIELKNGERWVAGAYEGTLLRSDFSIRQHTVVNYLVSRKVRRFIANPDKTNFQKTENDFTKYSAISLVDPVISFLSRGQIDNDRKISAALKLAKESDKREAVKFGIALLGECRNLSDDAISLLKTFAEHEEFTLYALVPLKKTLVDEERDSYFIELGDKLSGWGKLALFYELNFENENVRDWAIRKGCKNDIGLSYLANACAIKGKMKDYLESCVKGKIKPDKEHADGICDIFEGLLNPENNNDSIYEYPDAKDSAGFFRELVKKNPALFDDRAGKIIDKLTI